MFLAIDVGNTHTVFGLYIEGALAHEFRMETRAQATRDEMLAFLSALFSSRGLRLEDVEAVGVACVVPTLLYSLSRLGRSLWGQDPFVVDHRVDSGLTLRLFRPEEVGADRIVNASEAYHRLGASILVDFGTATTFDVVSPEGEYLGGCITPGVIISMEALYQRASKLPRVHVTRPDRVLGQSTVTAMQAGVYYGYAAMVDGLVDRLRQELTFPVKVAATGGLAPLIARDSRCIEQVFPNLTLDGIHRLWRRSTGLHG
ncbi:MAG: type III pantothenate kinase [Deltaproteobacteria bacterium]|nr:type III pantothenate kinase [Deltaproteobacteria bacterium]